MSPVNNISKNNRVEIPDRSPQILDRIACQIMRTATRALNLRKEDELINPWNVREELERGELSFVCYDFSQPFQREYTIEVCPRTLKIFENIQIVGMRSKL